MKIKYTAGVKAGKEAEVEKSVAEQLVADGLATAVAPDEMDVALAELTKSLETTINEKVGAAEKRLLKGLNTGIDKARITVTERSLDDPTGGFKSIGEFAIAVRRMSTTKTADERLLKLAMQSKADGMDESVLADGGALVPVEYSAQLYRDVLAEDDLFAKARKYPITSGNSIIIPVRSMATLGVTNSTNGSLGTWLNADGVAISPTKPVYNRVQFTLNRWGALLPVTDELLADNNVALSNFIYDEGAIALAHDLNQAFINGTGSGQPTGILESSVLVEAAADSGQTNYTISYSNLVNMKARLWTPRPNDFSDVVWLAHPDCEAQFAQLKDSAGRNLYVATGTLDQRPKAKLFGIPIVWSWECASVGSAGDVILADLSQYGIATKAAGAVEEAMSIHFYFDAAETAYRIIYRVAGQPMRSAPLTIPTSANTRSPFVCIAARGGGPAS